MQDINLRNDNNEVDIVAYLLVLKKYRKMISCIVFFSVVMAVIISLLMPKSFRAEATIMSVSSKGGGLASIGSQLGGLASLAGVGLAGGLDDTVRFLTILKSRTLAEGVIKTSNLLPILFEDSWDKQSNKWRSSNPKHIPSMETAVRVLRGKTFVSEDKKSKTIKIAAEFSDPVVASMVVNAFVEELQKFINANSFTTAKRNRIFIEGQLEENKRDLLNAGKEINEFYKGNRVSAAEAQVDVSIDQIKQKALPEVGALDSKNGELEKNAIISELLAQKSELDKKIEETKIVRDVPQQVYLNYLTMRRELLAKVNALLTTQYEMAKIEEAKEDLSFQVIDKAVPPEKKFKPKRAQIVMMTFFASLFLSIFLAFFLEYLEKMKRNFKQPV